MEFLNTLLKDKNYVALAYVTGIIPIKINENQFFLNNFNDYSMISSKWMAEYIGFTNTEVKMLCKKQKKLINQKELLKQKIKTIENDYIDDSKNISNKRKRLNISINNNNKKQKLDGLTYNSYKKSKNDNEEIRNKNVNKNYNGKYKKGEKEK